MPNTRVWVIRPIRGLHLAPTFEPSAPALLQTRPKVAVLREQGVNSHVEMAYAFTAAGFDAFDVHMSDLLAGRARLADYQGIVACGGFSYGDTLGAGIGWARSITFHKALADQFQSFFGRADTFGLGVCNGCQMFAELADIIPGAEPLAAFHDQPERALRSAAGHGRGAGFAVAVSCRHGGQPFADCGRARRRFCQFHAPRRCRPGVGGLALYRQPWRGDRAYPFNPNGSPGGLTGVTTPDGRFTAMMPHPERVFRNVQLSWTDQDKNLPSPWMQLWHNARRWVG